MRKSTEEKYFAFLKEVNTALKYTDNISLSKFIDNYGVSKMVYKPLVEGKILETNGIRGSGCRYKWITIEPNIAMSKELIRRSNSSVKVSRDKQEKLKFPTKGGKREGAGRKPLIEEVRKLCKKKISIAWGLIKIEY